MGRSFTTPNYCLGGAEGCTYPSCGCALSALGAKHTHQIPFVQQVENATQPVPPGDFPHYDKYLKLIADAQRYKLRLNAHKGDLADKDVSELLRLMKREIEELEEAISRGSEIEIILEAADISNFVLGIVVSAVRNMGGK